MADAASLGSALQAQIADRALQYATPATIPYVQRSAYLADALNQMRQSGGQNLRTPVALGSNLLANALLQYAGRKANTDLQQHALADQQNTAGLMLHGLPDPTQAAAPGAPSGGGVLGNIAANPPPAAGVGQPAPQPAAAPLPQAPATPPQPTPDMDAIIRTVAGEARGESPVGQQAVASVILNRAKATGLPPSAIVSAPKQFQGYEWGQKNLSPSDPLYQQIAQNITPALNGQDPTNGADHFYNPKLANPAWGGQGMDIGNHRFMALGRQSPGMPPQANVPPQQGNVQLAGAIPPGGLPSPAAPPPAPPATGAAPGGPAVTAPGAAAPLVQAPPPAAAAGPQSPPHGLAPTPDEWNRVQMLIHSGNPMLMQQGMQMAGELQKRYLTPPAPPTGMMWGQNGQVVPIPGNSYQTVSSGPGGAVQADPFGQYHATSNPNSGPLGANQTFDASGNVVNRQVQQQPTFKIPGANGVFVNGPDGRPVKVADDQFTPKDLGDRLTKLQDSDQYKLADLGTNMYNAAVQAAGRPGGISDVELRDFAARQFSGGVARQFNVEALNKAQGPWQRLQQFVPELTTGQAMSPGARQAVLQAMHDDAIQAQNAFKARSASDEAFVNAQGASLTPYLEPLHRPIPDVPALGTIPGGMPGVQPGNGAQPAAGGANRLFPSTLPGQAGASGQFTRQQLLDEAKRRGLTK